MYLKEFSNLYGVSYPAVKQYIKRGKNKEFFSKHTKKDGNYLILDEIAIEKLKSIYNSSSKRNASELYKIRVLLEKIVENNNKGFFEKLAEKLGLTF